MHTCPYCKKNLGDIDHIMDQLAQNKLNGELFFQSSCCNRKIRAYSSVGIYYIDGADAPSGPQLIGAA